MYRRCVVLILSTLVILTLVGRSVCELDPLPPTPNYKAADVKYEDGGMGPLFDFARSFINTALPDGFPTEFIEDTINGDGFEIVSFAKKALQMFKGYIAAIVVGFLFILIVPLVGLCFCCCRLCGKCGGNGKQQVTDNMHCIRRILATIVLVLTIFTLVGTICTFVSNDRMSTSLDKVKDIVDNNLNDIELFLDHIIAQVDVIGGTNLNKTQSAIIDKLDENKLTADISAFIVNELGNGALDTLEQNIKSILAAFDDVDLSMQAVNNSCGGTCTSVLSIGIDKAALTSFRNDDTVAKVKAEIGNSVKLPTNMGDLQKDAGKAFDDIKDKVGGIRVQINDFKSNADDGIDIESYKDQAKSYIDTAKQFDKYRHIAGSVLAGMITLIVSLQFLGLVFGSFGQGLKTDPDKRGCVSNSGGNMLIASVAFIFIFSWLLMLLTTISFSVGALMERFVCQPLSPPDFQLLKVAESEFDVTGTLGAPIGSVLRDCKAGKAAYEAFRFEGRILNFTDIEKQMEVQQNKIATQMTKALGSLNKTNMNTGNATEKATASLDELASVLNKMNFVTGPLTAIPQDGSPYSTAILDLKRSLDNLKKFKTEIPKWKTAFLASLKNVETNIVTQTQKIIDKFQNEIVLIGWDFLNTTKRQVREELGKCTPLWNLYDSIVIVSFCSYIVDAFNGFWFSIGWCLFFFVPSIIFSVKLAKHYRTMNGNDPPFGDTSEFDPFPYETSNHMFRSNQVEPSDDVPMSQY